MRGDEKNWILSRNARFVVERYAILQHTLKIQTNRILTSVSYIFQFDCQKPFFLFL